ncbi:MAG: phytanoyl-CoA dioxygenase family protein [Candidatus Dormibacteria bacterium]
MRTEVTPEEIAYYQDNGFVIVEDLLTPDELEDWREAIANALVARGTSTMSYANSPQAPTDEERNANPEANYYATVFTQRVNLWQSDERVKELIVNETIGKMAADLAQVDGMRMWHDQALIKEPWASPTAFHLDVPYWSFTSPASISIWVALDDATLQNGCMTFIPGSHKDEKYANVPIGKDVGGLFREYPEWDNIMPVACPIKAGSCTFHNGLTAHGAGANLTPGRRRAMTAGFMPDGCTYNGQANILPEEIYSKLKVGDLLDDPAQNPLLYSRARSVAAT